MLLALSLCLASYGRNGWRAGYGTKAFGAAGWAVLGWDDGGSVLEKSGFSFAKLDQILEKNNNVSDGDPNKLISISIKHGTSDSYVPEAKKARH